MENSLKQRIIGAVVLIALAVIFLPALLKENITSGPFVTKIPMMPEELKNYKIDIRKIDDLVKEIEQEKNSLMGNDKETLSQNDSEQGKSLAARSPLSASNRKQGEFIDKVVSAQIAQSEKAPLNSSKTSQSKLAKSKVTAAKQQKKPSTSLKNVSTSPASSAKGKPSTSNNKKNNLAKSQSTVAKLEQKQSASKSTTSPVSRAKTPSSQSVKAKTMISDQFKDAAWVIQVASFSRVANANLLVKKLKDNQYKAYRRNIRTGGKSIYRVFVGPYIDKQVADNVVSTISFVSESNAMLKVFDPIEH